jgi:hypothetical protein
MHRLSWRRSLRRFTIVEDYRKVLARLNALAIGENVKEPSRSKMVSSGRLPGGSLGTPSARISAYRNG